MQPTVQMRSLIRGHIDGTWLRPGEAFWTSVARARTLLGQGLAEPIAGPGEVPTAGPSEAPMAAPSETAIAGPGEIARPGVPEKKNPFRRGEGWPLDRFCTVERAWAGDLVVCIGSGPSLSREEVATTREARDKAGRQLRVIAVNDNYLLAPWADVLYFADARWWKWHREREEYRKFAGAKCSIFTTGSMLDDKDVFFLKNNGAEGLSLEPGALCTGANSGYQAVNLAVLAGASKIALLGYDARPGPGGRNHWFGDHPDRSSAPYDEMRKRFRTMVVPLASLGVEVLNCTPGSAIDCFPRVRLAELFA